MNLALDWMLENSRSSDAIICSDSQSLIISIESRQSNVMDIISKLQQLKGRVIIQWVPGHSNIPGNEMADRYAKAAAQNVEPTANSLSYNTARREIKEKRNQRPPSPTSDRVQNIRTFVQERREKSRVKERSCSLGTVAIWTLQRT